MDKAFYTFKAYLEELYETNKEKHKTAKLLQRADIGNQQLDIERVLNSYSLFENGYNKNFNYLVYNDFSILSYLLSRSSLSIKDTFAIISYAIKFNLRPLADKLNIYESALDLDEQYLDKNERRKKRKDYINRIIKQTKHLSNTEKKRISFEAGEKIGFTFSKLHVAKIQRVDNLDEVINQCRIFNELIISNQYYIDDDVDKAMEALTKLLVYKKTISEISEYLKENKLEKPTEIKPSLKEFEKQKEKTPSACEKKFIHEHEKERKRKYKELLNQVLEYYNPETKEFVSTIPYERIIDIAGLLLELGYQEEDVYSFFKKSKGYLDDETPIKDYSNLDLDNIFNLLNTKFSYYANMIDGIEDHINNYVNYYNELFNAYSEDDYKEWFELWLEEINTILSMIGTRYDYEIETAKALRKEN